MISCTRLYSHRAVYQHCSADSLHWYFDVCQWYTKRPLVNVLANCTWVSTITHAHCLNQVSCTRGIKFCYRKTFASCAGKLVFGTVHVFIVPTYSYVLTRNTSLCRFVTSFCLQVEGFGDTYVEVVVGRVIETCHLPIQFTTSYSEITNNYRRIVMVPSYHSSSQ